MSDTELLPCPFCGCSMELERITYPNGESEWQIDGWHSDKCIFEVSFHIPGSKNKRKLIRAWNRRESNE